MILIPVDEHDVEAAKVNASYLNLLVLAAEMQQVHDSCDDHGSRCSHAIPA
jgi:hypothetical protein